MAAPKIPEPKDPKSQATPVNVSPLSARVAATQPLPRQVFGTQQQEPLSAALTGAGSKASGRYDPRMAMELLKRGGGAA